MLKFSILLFNTLALLIYQFLFTEGVTVTQSIPSAAKPDSEFTVVLTINKGATAGFAKLQQELPVGFTAIEDKNNSASFSFSNQTVKFIWMALPNDAEFQVSYKVKVDAGISGEQTIAGKFSYVIDNAKQTSEIPPSTITIGSEGGTTAIAQNTPTDTPTDEPDEPTDKPTSSTKSATGAESSPFTCVRKVPSTTSGEFTVEITVNKANLSGFAKLMEVLPYGFTATVVESAGASFSFADQKARFIWVTLPAKPEFKISYKVKVVDVTGDQIIDGVFSYIENDETQKKVLETSTISVSANASSTSLAKNDDSKNDDSKNDDTKNDDTKNDDSTNDDSTNDDSTIPLSPNNIPKPQGSIIYHVQILALRKDKSESVIGNLYNINPSSIDRRMEEGFRKYLVGSHNEYKDARNARETFKPKGVIAPFVTAYNRGKRTTVQDALMVTNQKWYR